MVRMRRNFTLVELLVSLGVFSILLVLFMQFFSGMRLAWTNTEKRTDASYSARIAMDMVAHWRAVCIIPMPVRILWTMQCSFLSS